MIGRAVFEAAKKKGMNMRSLKVAAAVEVPGANYGVIRSSGIKDAMKEYGISGDIEIVDATLEMTTAEQRITSYLIGHPDVDCIFGLGGITTDRLTPSLKNAGKKPGEILAGGFDTTPGTLTGIKQDYMVSTIDQQQYLQGYFSVYVLYLMKNYGFAPQIDTGGYLVTKGQTALLEKLSPMNIR
jgi:simple sugar transport system substrate-binding protein